MIAPADARRLIGAAPPPGGKLALNVMHFARLLRAAGLAVGPARTALALDAIEAIGPARREDFYWALFAVFVKRSQDRALFDQAFHLFWRDPKLLERAIGLLLPELERVGAEEERDPLSRRLAEAMKTRFDPGRGEGDDEAPPEIEIDATLTWSKRETLQTKDFEQMSAAEIAQAKRAIAALRLPLDEVRTRRFRADPRGAQIDMRKSLRAASRSPLAPLAKKSPRTRRPPLVLLCDVSGSMSVYARMLLHFAHALAGARDRVHSFVFGMRLTNVTRALRDKDVDEALAKVGGLATDWDGGTRIGHCLERFNAEWSRRVLGQGAVVLLVTDGLDREAGQGLERAMERLRKSTRRLIWLNPLLRWDGYRPLARGAAIMIRHCDDFRAAHSLESLEALAALLSGAEGDPRADAHLRRHLREGDQP